MRTLDQIWADLEKAEAEYGRYCAEHAAVEDGYRKMSGRVKALRLELGELQDSLPACIDCGGKPAGFNGPQVPGSDPSTPLGDYKIMCMARLPDRTEDGPDGPVTIPGEKACRRVARGKTWQEALDRWDPIGAAARSRV